MRSTHSRTLLFTGVISVVGACASEKTAHETPQGGAHAHGDGHHGAARGHEEPGAHGHHRFDDAEEWAVRFEDPARDAWQRPEIVIAALALSPSSKVADIGAATGYFPVRIAPHVKEGIVYGVDVEERMVSYLEARATREGLANLRAVKGEADDARIPEPVDVILLVNTYHHIEERPAYFARLRQSLLPGGRVVVVDFKMGELPFGPPESMRVAPDEIRTEMGQAGYVLSRDDRTSLPHQVILIFTPRG
jgi:SAM-dependent methyltransferase